MTHFSNRGRRKGVVLLVVIAMLALFAAVGLSFVYYAQAEANASRVTTQAQTQALADVDPGFLFSYWLSQLLYDTENLNSAMRGHSLARLLYGSNPNGKNHIPFNGYGRLRYALGSPNAPTDNYEAINYQYFRNDNFRRDPEHHGLSPTPTDPNSRGPYLGGANVPYTYPDLNNMFLAAVNADGEVLQPSFYRSWTGVNLADTTDPRQKYLTLRPHKVYHRLFPDPTPGGDVKNLDNAKGTKFGTGPGATYDPNDSYWIDAGFPILVAPNGKRYKPLFAPLVMDLDGKVNLNAAGNIRATNGTTNNTTHVSNHGYGPWEINLAKVMNHATQADLLTFIKDYRYNRSTTDTQGLPWDGAQQLPADPTQLPPPPYARVDIDGGQQAPGYTPSVKMRAPWELGTFPYPGYYGLPYFDAGSYGNGDTNERDDHPRMYHPLAPQGGDRRVEAYHLEALLRYAGTNSPSLRSDLFLTSPANFGNPPDANSAKRRRLVTTHSMDFGRPGLLPWLSSPGTTNYQLAAGQSFPSGTPIASPTPPTFPGYSVVGPPPGDGEFDDFGRGFNPFLTRLNLNRRLGRYPIDAAGRIDPNDATAGPLYLQAKQDREELARDIFNVLRFVTTGARPGTPPPPAGPEYDALRWLAQLAVNMVDFTDTDDIMTGLNWNPTAANEWVFGTEMPRVLINEAYVEHVRPGSASPRGNAWGLTRNAVHYAWLELHNPHIIPAVPSDLSDGGDARLHMVGGGPGGNYAIYRVIIAKLDPARFTAPGNTLGDPAWNDAAMGDIYDNAGGGASTKAIVKDFSAKPLLKASATPIYASPGAPNNDVTFYVLGPDQVEPPPPNTVIDFEGGQVTPTHKQPEMAFKVPAGTPPGPVSPNFVLQRLANPALPPQAVPTDPNYNPYITVDYTPPTDSIDEDQNGFSGKKAKGRRQPNAAHTNQWVPQDPDTDPGMMGVQPYANQPQHTFFRHNGVDATPPAATSLMLQQPFDWLLHYNRPLVSPMELFHVSGYRPADLTQKFITSPGPIPAAADKFNHLPRWLDPNTRLYRFFEFVDTGHRAGLGTTGVSFSGRIPGKININTIWDKEILEALIDPQVASLSGFDVASLFTQLQTSRFGSDTSFGTNNKPFRSLATPTITPAVGSQFPSGAGFGDTLLRPSPSDATKFLFENPTSVSGGHPYEKMEVLSKIFNNVTTRSNCFAVWLTVGFFEVFDEVDSDGDNVVDPAEDTNSNGVFDINLLGKEIGKDENRHIRHRMFAIIDRTDMSLFTRETQLVVTAGSTVDINNLLPATTLPTVPPTVLAAGQGKNTLNGNLFNVEEGMLLTIDSGTLTEEVVVKRSTATPFPLQVTLSMAHGGVDINNQPIKYNVVARGNPGPVPSYDIRKDNGVVLHWSAIQ
jgi:hypothetical protein